MVTRMPRRKPKKWPAILAAVIALVIALLSLASIFFIDLLWFQEVGFSQVFWGTIWSKVLLGAVAGALFFAILYVNLLIVRRLAPKYRVLSPEQEVIERYRIAFEPWLKWIVLGFSLVLALMVGVGVSAQWKVFLLWRNSGGVAFGDPDPVFGRDPAFYIFQLPFLKLVQGWLFSSLVSVTVLVAVAHYLWGGIRPQAVGERVTPQVKAHLSVLLGLIVIVKAWGYYLGRFDLLTSERGVVTGASYTDLHAQLPALNLLLVVALVCAVLFFVNIRLKGWGLPVIGVGLLALVSVVAGGLFPAFIQQVRVDPQELQQERPYIARNIEFTRTAFGLDKIQTSSPDVAPDLTSEDLVDNATTLANIRLWDPFLLQENYNQLQRIKQYYEFPDSADVDRYTLGGEKRVVMGAVREISQGGIPEGGGTWQNRHLVYTHGYGMVASQVNGSTEQGSPLFILQDIPPRGSSLAGSEELAATLNAGQPRIYYGERSDVPFVVVGTKAEELDYQGTAENDNAQVSYRYEGDGGIPIDNYLRKALFAWRFRDFNLLISGLVTDDSRVMIYRSIRERVQQAAPFLTYDADPYAAIVGGRVVWIWDAYTTANNYPYSQRMRLSTATSGEIDGAANYIRNSVKVVIDAYDGSMKFYVVDEEDPVIQVWRSAFPDLFTPITDASTELREHFRYPENLLQVQATQFSNYHVTDPAVFYQKQDFWAIPVDPAAQANVTQQLDGAQTFASGAPTAGNMRPYYVLLKPPGSDEEEFSLILPFTPQGRQNMVAWMAAASDPDHYGDVVSYEFPAGRNVDGPVQVFNQIQSYPPFAEQQTLLSKGDSTIRYGNLLVIPMGDSFLYVQPVFVQSKQANAFPELKRVVVVHGGTVGIGATLNEALLDSGVSEDGSSTGQGPKQETGPSAQVDELLAEALVHFQAADEALRAGDLATYQLEIDKARELVSQATAASLKSEQADASGSAGSQQSASPDAQATPTGTPTP